MLRHSITHNDVNFESEGTGNLSVWKKCFGHHFMVIIAICKVHNGQKFKHKNKNIYEVKNLTTSCATSKLIVSSAICVSLTAWLPVLDNEMYKAVKPGLSAYGDHPEEVSLDYSHHTIMNNIPVVS